MGDLLAFGQGLVDSANNRLLENRKARYEAMLRDRELKDWKEKENYSSGIRLKEDETTRARNKTQKDQEAVEKRQTAKDFLMAKGYEPDVADKFADGFAKGVWSYNDFQNDNLKFKLGKDGKPKPVEEVDREDRVARAERQADELGYKGPVKQAMVNYATDNTDGVAGFLSKFVIKNGQVISREMAVAEGNNATSLRVAEIGAGAKGSNNPWQGAADWQYARIDDLTSQLLFDKMYELTGGKNGGLRRESYSYTDESGASKTATRIVGDNPLQARYLGIIRDRARTLAQDDPYHRLDRALGIAAQEVESQFGTISDFAASGGKPKGQATPAPTGQPTSTGQPIPAPQAAPAAPVDPKAAQAAATVISELIKMDDAALAGMTKEQLNQQLEVAVRANPALEKDAIRIVKKHRQLTNGR